LSTFKANRQFASAGPCVFTLVTLPTGLSVPAADAAPQAFGFSLGTRGWFQITNMHQLLPPFLDRRPLHEMFYRLNHAAHLRRVIMLYRVIEAPQA
jgi:hypothetical protein